MALIEINHEPTSKDLRMFAAIWMPAACAVIATMIWWKLHLPTVSIAIMIVAAGAAFLGLLSQALCKKLYLGWMYAVMPIGWIVSHALFAGVYYLVLTPLAIVMRLGGYDPMKRAFDPAATTYWEQRSTPRSAKRYFNQF